MHKISAIIITLFALAAISCSEGEDFITGGDGGKEPISFSVSDEGARSSRGGFHGGDTFLAMRMQSVNKKDGAASLYTVTTATACQDNINDDFSYSEVDFKDDQIRYWDDAHGQYSVLSVYAVAIPNMETDVMGLKEKLTPGSNNSAKWGSNATNTIAWTVSQDQTKDDTGDNAAVVTAGSGTIDQEDLVYSNNIQNGGEDGVYRWDFDDSCYKPDATGKIGDHANGPMMFIWETFDPENPMHTPAATVGKFDKGHLVFKHALSRITVKLTAGDGFTDPGAFLFTDDSGTPNGSTIRLSGMPTGGTLDLPTGTWSDVTTDDDITKMGRKGTGSTAAGTFMGQMLPGYVMKDGDKTAVMEFTIDGNTYYVTQDMLYDALVAKGANTAATADYGYDATAHTFTMLPGKNYRFEFNVKKRQVEIASASLIAWEDVDAEIISMNNARIKLQVEERGTAQTTDVAFYKANDNKTTEGIDDNYTTWNWTTGYTNLGATYINDHWETSSYWETSKDFYHFRALMPAATAKSTDTTPDPDEDYATLTSGASYTDVCWGAPMLDVGDNETSDATTLKWLYGPTSGGFDHSDDNKVATGLPANTAHQIYKAIGATNDPVKLTLFHMMSDVTFNIKTTEGSDKVELCHDNGTEADPHYTHTRLDLVGFYKGGKVLLGTGLVKTDGSVSTIASPVTLGAPTAGGTGAYDAKTYHYGAVPQDLTAVKLYITTPDGNQYIIDLKDVKATAVTTNNLANPYSKGSDNKYTLSRWYPGFRYTYSFTLKKTGITNLQATVVNWENVAAADETVTIK